MPDHRLEAVARRQHPDQRGGAHDDAEGGEEGAYRVAAQGLKPGLDRGQRDHLIWDHDLRRIRAARSSVYAQEMIHPQPAVLEGNGIRLEPMTPAHEKELAVAVADGALWELWYVATPTIDGMAAYIETALKGQQDGHMLPWVVRDLKSMQVVGATRYHDIVANVDRVEIGYTWYAERHQRTHVNTTCKLLLLGHAFDTLGCKVVGLRTDGVNFRSQRAIEALGAKKDGVIRHAAARKDGSPRDVVMYSILRHEWPDVRRHLESRLRRHGSTVAAS
jgi:RimJ/RimL family protein N-acetyltransferase